MTRIVVAFGFCVSVFTSGGSTVYSQTGARAKDPALQAAIEARQKATDSRNPAEWSKYTTDDYVQITEGGVLNTRAERMKALSAVSTAPTGSAVIESIRTYGTDTAITIQRNPVTGSRVTLVWVRQGGEWKVASGQGTAAPKKIITTTDKDERSLALPVAASVAFAERSF